MKLQLFIYFGGLAITSLGIALVVHSTIGAGPWDAVAVGLKDIFGLTIGTWSIIAQSMLVLITALVEKARIRVESVVVIIIRSWFLDFWYYIVLGNTPFTATFETQIATFAAGILAVGIGIGIYIEANFPKSPVDGLMIAVSEQYGWSLKASRLTIECSGVLTGLLLSGPIGLGTVIVALSLGRIIQLTNTQFKKILMNRASGEKYSRVSVKKEA